MDPWKKVCERYKYMCTEQRCPLKDMYMVHCNFHNWQKVHINFSLNQNKPKGQVDQK